MSNPLLVTKIYRPQSRPGILLRPGLFAALDAGLSRRLTILSAPAGFGKTTLLCAWLEQLMRAGEGTWATAWLSLDASDNDPQRFWAYLTAAMQNAVPGLAADLLSALQSPNPVPTTMWVAGLINAVSGCGQSMLLALDDYHIIHNEEIHASLNELLDRLPDNLRIYLTTREDPPLALARRRARRELAELRAAQLRLNPDETAQILKEFLGLGLEAAQVDAIYRRTEGWAVGVQLAGLTLQSRPVAEWAEFIQSFSGDDQFIFDYLMDEVFSRLNPDQQDFLLQTSVLERMCAPLCQELTGMPDCAARLQSLERANLFTQPLDNRRHWYRYHPLFADLLRKRLSETLNQGEVRRLYKKAAAWHEHEEHVAEAVKYAQGAQDVGFTAQLLERNVLTTFYRSEIYQVYDWLKALPESILADHPLLGGVYGNSLALIFATPDAYQKAESRLQTAEKALAAGKYAHEPALEEETRAYLAKFRAYLAAFQGASPEELIRLAQTALDRIPASVMRFRSALNYLKGRSLVNLNRDDEALIALKEAQRAGSACGDWFNALAAYNLQANIAFGRGDLAAVEAICREALAAVAEELPPAQAATGMTPPGAGSLYVTLGLLKYEWNDLEQAERLLRRGLELLALTTMPEVQAHGLCVMGYVAAARGDLLDALENARQAEAIWPFAVEHLQPLTARLWLALAAKDHASARALEAWALKQNWAAEKAGEYDLGQIVLARWLLAHTSGKAAQRHPARAGLEAFLNRQLQTALEHKRAGWAIEILVLQALAAQSRGLMLQAGDRIEQALTLAPEAGYTRYFLDFGPDAAVLLRLALERPAVKDAAARLLAVFAAEAPTWEQSTGQMQAGPQVDQLSERELEVLQLLAEGLTNGQIAQRLHLSTNTVRAHASKIYEKLGVNSRTQAAARARALGYLIHP